MACFDFDRIPERRGTDCLKWDGMNDRFGPVPEDALPMWVADMDFLSPPCVVEALEKRAAEGVFGYAHASRSTFEAVAGWMNSIHGWAADPEWINSCSGVMPAVGVAIRAFSMPGDGVVIQPPVYPPFFSIIKDNGRTVIENPLVRENGHFRIDLEGLESLLSDPRNSIFLLCSPHNPVGRVWEREELETIAHICSETGTLLIADEIHADIVFRPHRHIPVSSLDRDLSRNIITCVSPSKTFNIPGLQTAYTIIPETDLRGKFQDALRSTKTGGHNNFGLAASDAAYRFGAPWRESMLEYVKQNRDLALSFFKGKMPWVDPCIPEGTYLMWLDFSACGESPGEVTERLIQKGKVVLDPGIWFGEEGAGWQRLNLACPRILLEDGLDRIKRSFE